MTQLILGCLLAALTTANLRAEFREIKMELMHMR